MSSVPPPPIGPEEIIVDAGWLVQALDAQNGLVRVVRMDSDAYRKASFLDDRMLQEQHFAGIVPWQSVAGAVPEHARSDARWIFHIGHVGSTLVARLLGELEGVLSIREPRVLRDLALLPAVQRADYARPLQKLMSRAFAVEEFALVKATSFVSEIGPELVPPRERALFMYATPGNYVASILAGENSVKELAALAPSRAQRMTGRVALPEPRNAADAAAAAWACEMTSLEAANAAMADRAIAWADFDSMLADMPGELRRMAEFFGFPTAGIDEAARGPLMSRYSKATEYDYSPSLRAELIAEAAAANRADIDAALAMLRAAADKSPLLQKALRRAECTESSSS
jgi:hypothetical protein